MTLKNTYTGTVLQIYDNRYVGKDGLFLYYASDTAPGKGYVFFFTARPSGKYLRTARGVVDIDGDEIIVTTKNSRYHFKMDDSLFSDTEIDFHFYKAVTEFNAGI